VAITGVGAFDDTSGFLRLFGKGNLFGGCCCGHTCSGGGGEGGLLNSFQPFDKIFFSQTIALEEFLEEESRVESVKRRRRRRRRRNQDLLQQM
jgi:hypothetical protein